MYCPKCGKKCKDGAKFCGNCGENLEALQDIVSDSDPSKESLDQDVLGVSEESGESTTEKVFGNRKRFLLVVICIAACVVIIVVALFAHYRNNGQKFQTYMTAGRVFLENEEYEEAVVELDAAIQIKPKEVEPYQPLAEAYLGMNEIKQAGITYETAIEIILDDYNNTGEFSEYTEELYEGAVSYCSIYGNIAGLDELETAMGISALDIEGMEEAEDTSNTLQEDTVSDTTVMTGMKTNEDLEEDINGEKSIFEAYYDKLIEYQELYGEAEIEESDFIENTLTGEHKEYASGLFMAKLIDFNNDGVDELFLLYSNTDSAEGVDTFEYIMEIWGYDENNLIQIFKAPVLDVDSEDPSIWVEFPLVNGNYCLFIHALFDANYEEDTWVGCYAYGFQNDEFVRIHSFYEEGYNYIYLLDGEECEPDKYYAEIDPWSVPSESAGNYEIFPYYEGDDDESFEGAISELQTTLDVLKNS